MYDTIQNENKSFLLAIFYCIVKLKRSLKRKNNQMNDNGSNPFVSIIAVTAMSHLLGCEVRACEC